MAIAIKTKQNNHKKRKKKKTQKSAFVENGYCSNIKGYCVLELVVHFKENTSFY